MKEASSVGKNVETYLNFLPNLDILEFLRFIRHKHITDAPVEPGEGCLDVKRRVLDVPILGIVYFVDLLE